MRLSALLGVVAVTGVLSVTTVSATPSTQIWIPSTDIQKFANPHFGWDEYLSKDGIGWTVGNGGITIGVLPFEKVGMEIGVDYRDINGNHLYPIYTNAKLGVPEDAFFQYMPAVVIGGYDFGFVSGMNDYNLVYGLAAKNIWKLGRFSAGYYYSVGDTALMYFGDPDRTKSGVLLSWDRTISEISDKLWLAIDYQGGTNAYGALSFGVAWSFAPNASVILGYDIFNNTAFGSTVTMQVDMNLF